MFPIENSIKMNRNLMLAVRNQWNGHEVEINSHELKNAPLLAFNDLSAASPPCRSRSR
jgi:hypothetical protein